MSEQGSLARWIPEMPQVGTETMLVLLDARRAIIDRVGSWEEMKALCAIRQSKVDELTRQLSACEHSEPWQVRRWEGERDRAIAQMRQFERLMRQQEMEACVYHARFVEIASAASNKAGDNG